MCDRCDGCDYCDRFVRKQTDALPILKHRLARFSVSIHFLSKWSISKCLFYDEIAGMWSLRWLPSFCLSHWIFVHSLLYRNVCILLQNNLECLQFLCWNNGSQCSDRIFLGMSFHMFGQMIATHKRFRTNFAYETFFTCVRTLVSWQFIGSWETTFTILPFANEWSFAGVNALMCLQMAGFKVILTTIWIGAFVNASTFRWCLWRGWYRIRTHQMRCANNRLICRIQYDETVLQ